MGKGVRSGAIDGFGRGRRVRGVPALVEPSRVWHYTATQDAIDIEQECALLPGSWGTDGPGVYVTDLEPNQGRSRISREIWNRWRPRSMEAFIGLPFIAGEMEPGRSHRHVWVVKKSELRLTGLEDMELGFWRGADPSAAEDEGTWLRRPVRGCW